MLSFKHLIKVHGLPLINKFLHPFSLKLNTANTPTRTFNEFFSHLERLKMEIRTVIDVGVAFGTPGIYKSLPGAKFYLVEPVPSCKPLLEKLCRELNAEAFNVAVGDIDGTMDFFVHSDISGSSAFRQIEGADFDGVKQEVPVRRLDSLIVAPLQRPALLKIDTQGAELKVLAGAGHILDEIDVIILEVSLHQFRHGVPEFYEIVAAMHELGFVCYDILDGEYRALDKALAQIDLAFVRKDSELRREKGFFAPDQAAKYLEVHKSQV